MAAVVAIAISLWQTHLQMASLIRVSIDIILVIQASDKLMRYGENKAYIGIAFVNIGNICSVFCPIDKKKKLEFHPVLDEIQVFDPLQLP